MAKAPTNKQSAPRAPKKTAPKPDTKSLGLLPKLKTALVTPRYGKTYAVVCLLVLAATSLVWAVLGAKLQQSNADQLVNPYLFESSDTAHNAVLPGDHSFLIKWPLFFIIKLFGYSSASFTTITVISVLATVLILALLLYRIERRPLYFGTICLALASVLLLVPAQPYAGGLLPVNMAMLATRNLEYMVYIAAVIMFIRSHGYRSWRFWTSAGLLGLLVASDKLFLGISVLSALIGLVIYSLRRRWEIVNISSSWLVATVVSAIVGITILVAVNASGLVHISSQSTGSPYGAISSGKQLALGLLYGAAGIFTNFGANPAYSATIVRDIPHKLAAGLFSLSGPAYIINLVILGICLFSSLYLLKASLFTKKSKTVNLDSYTSLGLVLLWSSLAALILFIVSNHYYAVDARYLTIFLFSLFICVAVWLRNRNWVPKHVAISGLIILVGVIFGMISAMRAYHAQANALSDTKDRNLLVAEVLNHHHVEALVGDYWRVIPIKSETAKKLTVTPLSSCFQNRSVLSSKNWQVDLKKHSFAYLLSLDRSLTDYHGCTLNEVIDRYGRPNSSALIAGSLSHPKELVLFYDRGAHLSSPKTLLKTPSTILPITLDELPYASCSVPTIMNIVAHQDDDLLFMNPDLLRDIKAGHCVRTIYVTAGDAGNGQFYWLNRQQGSEAAYSKMLGANDIWIDRIVKLSDHEFITIANPRGNSKISLIFMHLPDGGLKGDGFAPNNYEGLAKLDAGIIKNMHTIDNQSVYSGDELVTVLSSLMHTYQPSEIRTQSNFTSRQSNDHSDHMAVGRFVKKAYTEYEHQQFEGIVTIPLKYYIGYPIHDMPANVMDGELQAKEAAFFQYAGFDGAVCNNTDQCNKASNYGNYLSRQYQSQN